MLRLMFLAAVFMAHTSVAQVSNPYFPSQVGWSWTYVDFSGRVTETAIVNTSTIMGYDVIVHRNLTHAVESYYSIGLDGDVLYHGAFDGNGGSFFDPPVVIWKSGASLGSEWTSYSQAYCDPERASPVGPVRAYTYSVIEAGTIEVPAGEFEALRVRSTQLIGCSGDNQLGYFYTWRAVGIGTLQTEIPGLYPGALTSLVSWREPQVAVEQSSWGAVKATYR